MTTSAVSAAPPRAAPIPAFAPVDRPDDAFSDFASADDDAAADDTDVGTGLADDVAEIALLVETAPTNCRTSVSHDVIGDWISLH
jgi:hypothetical protein